MLLGWKPISSSKVILPCEEARQNFPPATLTILTKHFLILSFLPSFWMIFYDFSDIKVEKCQHWLFCFSQWYRWRPRLDTEQHRDNKKSFLAYEGRRQSFLCAGKKTKGANTCRRNSSVIQSLPITFKWCWGFEMKNKEIGHAINIEWCFAEHINAFLLTQFVLPSSWAIAIEFGIAWHISRLNSFCWFLFRTSHFKKRSEKQGLNRL